MTVKLYNSLSNKIEDLKPIDTGKISMYSCGPTVYNNLHIGNLSAFIYADILRRTLEVSGFTTKHVMNITDVDDKTIRDSRRDYPDDSPRSALKKLTDKYTHVFLNDLQATGNDTENIHFISAVDSIPDMIELIQKIADNGFAYAAEDGIYFSIEAYKKAGNTYGKLQKITVSHARSRVANDEYDKDSASDFALWKAGNKDEPSWDAEFTIDGKTISLPGRPGWHIECSAMSNKILGVPFDIHTGGIDLKFPHHENEIAQSCGAGANNFAHYFVHNAHILVDGRKMSKSLGNFYTLRDIEDQGFTAQDFRLLVLESHYRSESNFSWEILQAAKNRYLSLIQTVCYAWQANQHAQLLPDAYFKDKTEACISALSNDLSTPEALSIISSVVSDIEKHGGINPQNESELRSFIQSIDRAVGLGLSSVKDISDQQKELLTARQQAREDKNWKASDEIRDTLKGQGIGINDGRLGQTWYYTNN